MNSSKPSLRYWDSCCFVGWLAEEADKVDECRSVIRAAEEGRVKIVTSALALAEVVRLKKRTVLSREKAQLIAEFFMRDYIVVRQLDRFLAEEARGFVWNHDVDPKDAIHVATAIRAKVDQLDTFDGPLIRKSGKIGSPPLVIGRPNLPEQLSLVPVVGS